MGLLQEDFLTLCNPDSHSFLESTVAVLNNKSLTEVILSHLRCLSMSILCGFILSCPQNMHCSYLDHCLKFRLMKKHLRESGSHIHLADLGVSGEHRRDPSFWEDRTVLCAHPSFPLVQAVGVCGIFCPLPLDLCLENQSLEV